MFGYARTSGLPVSKPNQSIKNQMYYHQMARAQHELNAQRMKKQFDRQMNAKECPIRVGDQVLFKREAIRKDVSPWDSDPFNVTMMKGSMVTASRSYPKQQCITRNSSCFKLYRGLGPGELDVKDNADQAKADTHSEPTEQIETAEIAECVKQVSETYLNPNASRGVGRPTVLESEKMQADRQLKLKAKLAANPPTRVSARLKGLSASTIASFEKRGKILYSQHWRSNSATSELNEPHVHAQLNAQVQAARMRGR